MPYTPITNLSRRGEKIAPFVTMQNLGGVLAFGLVPWLLLASAPPLVRLVIALVGGVLGYILTLEVNGLSLVERFYWRMVGEVQALMVKRTISPQDMPGTVTEVRVPVIQRGGSIRMLPHGPQHHRRGSRQQERPRTPRLAGASVSRPVGTPLIDGEPSSRMPMLADTDRDHPVLEA